MNELMKIENGEIKLDSRMIAEHFRKAHSDVLKDIRDEIGKLENGGMDNEGIFSLVEYLDKKGEKRPAYEMTEEGALQLAARYDAVARRKLIIKIKELKQQNLYKLPKTYSEALRELADKTEQNETLQLENNQQKQIIGELKPKADYVDWILKNKGLVTITQIAKDYGMTAQQMNDLLHELKIQFKQSGQWLLYKEHHGMGYTHSETIDITRSDGRPDVKMNTKWTQKGRLFVYDTLKREGILPLIEQVLSA